MKLTRQQLRILIEQVVSEQSSSKSAEQWHVLVPYIGVKSDANSTYLQELLSDVAGKHLGTQNEISTGNFKKYLKDRGLEITQIGDTAVEISENVPNVQFIAAQLSMAPNKKGMFITLEHYLNGNKMNSARGPLEGMKAGEDSKATYGHKSNDQLKKYVKELLTFS